MKYLESGSPGTKVIGLLKPNPRITRLAQEGADGIPRAAFVAALQLEGIPCDGLFYEPVYKSSLFPVNPEDFPALSWERKKLLDLRNMYSCPKADRAAYHEAIWFMHQLFLGGRKDVDAIVDTTHKVLENIQELRGLYHKAIRNQKLSHADARARAASGCC
jgi:perosamine synthetase